MTLLNGLRAPEGPGFVVEVHLDIQNPTTSFIAWAELKGLKPDPFDKFYPPAYTYHMTGRLRCTKQRLHELRGQIDALIEEIICKARSEGVRLYVELEIVRGRTYFPEPALWIPGMKLDVLDGCSFSKTGRQGGALGDVHVKFRQGTASLEVRDYLSRNEFYWVSIPANTFSPAKDVATLQTKTFKGSWDVYGLLVKNPLPFCIDVAVEQKLSMRATEEGLVMPEIVEVSWH